MKHRISCIDKTDRFNPHERIHSIGGKNSDGTRWKLGQQEAVQGILAGKWQFFVDAGGRPVDVIVATHEGNRYLKTVPDGVHPNNLLSLDQCPV